MPDPTLIWLSSALGSYVASQHLLPTQNSEEPDLLTDPLLTVFITLPEAAIEFRRGFTNADPLINNMGFSD